MSERKLTPIQCEDGVEAVHEFFARLSRNCAARDYDATEVIFASDVASFGTKAEVVVGLGPLRAKQWEGIWGNIEDFVMLLDQVHARANADMAWGMVPWTSTGFDASGARYDRPGRATIAMERRNDEWLAVHSHFSLNPGTPPRTFGPQSS